MSPRSAPFFTGLVLLYLMLDLTAPSVPGAFTFEVSSSVEVVRLARDADDDRPAPLAEPDTLGAQREEIAITEPRSRSSGPVIVVRPVPRFSLARAALAPPLSEIG